MYWLVLCSVLLWLQASVFCTAQSSEDVNFRVARGFPQTTSFVQLIEPDERRKWRSHNGVVAAKLSADLNDLVNRIEAEQMMGRRRRSKDIGKYRRYACRFKFCRIFD